jgi:hypothetical protein
MKNLKYVNKSSILYLSTILVQSFYSTSANNKTFLGGGLQKIHRRGLHTLPVVPVKIYTNADLQKKSIIKDNKEKAGVYR